MNASITLILWTIVLLVILYFLTIAVINLLKKLIDHGRGAMKSIFILIGVIVVLWIVTHPEESKHLVQYAKLWIASSS